MCPRFKFSYTRIARDKPVATLAVVVAQAKTDSQAVEHASDDYRDRLYAVYASSHFNQADSSRPDPTFVRDIVRRLPRDLDLHMLDVGCGSGRLVRLIQDAGYSNIRGIDTSLEQVNEASRMGISGVEQADLFAFAQRHPQQFDVVIATDLLEHFDKPAVLAALDALAFSLKQGGLLIARTPNGQSPFAGRYRYGDFTHGTIFTPKSLRQVLTVTGFADLRFFPANPAVHGALSLVRWTLWQVLAALLKAMLVIESGPVQDLIVTQNVVVMGRRSRSAEPGLAYTGI